jgi:HEAT repeat protein
VIEAMRSPEARARCASRLARVLQQPEATLAARQYACLKLRQVGTPAEVPVLRSMLLKEPTADMARYALEAIAGEEATAALRAGLKPLEAAPLVGVVNSLGARRDRESVSNLIALTEADDPRLAAAALRALGRIGGPEAIDFLAARAHAAALPTEPRLAVPLLRGARQLATDGRTEAARAIYELLSKPAQPRGVRQAALEGLLGLDDQDAAELLVRWFVEGDPTQRRIAAGHLDELPEAELERLSGDLSSPDDSGKAVLLGVLAARRGKAVLPMVTELLESGDSAARLSGLRLMQSIADPSTVPMLVDALAWEGQLGEAARDTLARLPRRIVGPALLEALNREPPVRNGAVDVLVRLKYYDAIDPLIAMAGSDDPAVYGPALSGLRGIADPDEHDVPRLVKLLLQTPAGRHRDEVEKTILIVCQKQPEGADLAAPVLEAIEEIEKAQPKEYLPLLGRLGSAASLSRIEAAMESDDRSLREAAVRALCNWPNAEVADQLLELATDSDSAAYRRWALRAFVRVITLPEARPEAETLAMLQRAMGLAKRDEDRRLILERAATVRTMEAVAWIAEHLDDPAVAQAACKSIVELAHHRFLRHPNLKQFDPILKRVAEVADDPAVAQRARRYRLGL